MGHATENDPTGMVDAVRAERMAVTLQAIADPTRLEALTILREGPRTTQDLSSALDVEAEKLTPEMDRLSSLGLVVEEGGAYRLHDEHVGALLDEAVGHDAHLD
ncbi:ArsR family transcriptional regulator [Actinomycetospora sp. OC33-EN08]|uniref:ArsR family transcriptional regulator n=1 Tax=Actinomycetospora aurantiaca TaxID=3129233 RepID=A0ABU8ML95_9PSEU